MHRVLHPFGVLPQAADHLDASLPIYQNEILIEVEKLNIDSASFRQLKEECGPDAKKIAGRILAITREHGKMQNPVTGSGGMLIGQVSQLGPEANLSFQAGDKIATLVSLTLTPLHLEEIQEVNLKTAQVRARGFAILFASGVAANLPKDFEEEIAMAVLDVCGAPAWVKKFVRPEDRVLILGAGKSGMLSALAARDILNPTKIWMSDVAGEPLQWAKEQGWAGNILEDDARQPVKFSELLRAAGAPAFDLVVNTCNASETEMSSILAARQGGRILFFNMATQFSRAVLSAEGIGREVEMVMGNGYALGHWEYALDLVRRNPALLKCFAAR